MSWFFFLGGLGCLIISSIVFLKRTWRIKDLQKNLEKEKWDYNKRTDELKKENETLSKELKDCKMSLEKAKSLMMDIKGYFETEDVRNTIEDEDKDEDDVRIREDNSDE